MNYVSHLEAAIDGTILPHDQIQTLHNDRPIWVRYDLDQVGQVLTKKLLKSRPETIWRYRELLPVDFDSDLITLGEAVSPLLKCERLAAKFGLKNLWIKDESNLPTGSFKARGLVMAVNMIRKFGVNKVAIPTAGNAGGALAAYAARAGMEAYVFMPSDTPAINQYECALYGAKTFLVDGLITDCGKIVREGKDRLGWFDMSTLKEPYRIEGKKTMGLELAEQCDWRLPDVILYPTGGGTGLIGMWKAFNELKQLGWLESDTMPKMIAVQSDGCSPIVDAWDAGERFAKPFKNAATIAAGIRVPAAVGDFMIIDALKESGGCAVRVEESKLREWMSLANSTEGISVCPEASACVGALETLADSDYIKPEDRVVIFNTGGVQKYPEAMKTDLPRLDSPDSIDWDSI